MSKNKTRKSRFYKVFNGLKSQNSSSNEDFQIEEFKKEYSNITSSNLALDKYKYFPARICEIAETLNKFCLYVKGTSGRIFKLYMELIDRNAELLRLEKEKFFKEIKEK